MQIQNSAAYTQDADTIFATFKDEAFLKTKMEALGARNIEITIEEAGDTTKVTVNREMPADVPGALKKFISPWNKMTQKEVWTGSAGGPYHCDINIISDGVPVKVKGTMDITATDEGGSTLESATDIKCGIPFVGKLLAKFIGEVSTKVVDGELDYIGEHA